MPLEGVHRNVTAALVFWFAIFAWPLVQQPLKAIVGEGATTLSILGLIGVGVIGGWAWIATGRVSRIPRVGLWLHFVLGATVVHAVTHWPVEFPLKYYVFLATLVALSAYSAVSPPMSRQALRVVLPASVLLYGGTLLFALLQGVDLSERSVVGTVTISSANYVALPSAILFFHYLGRRRLLALLAGLTTLGFLWMGKSRGSMLTVGVIGVAVTFSHIKQFHWRLSALLLQGIGAYLLLVWGGLGERFGAVTGDVVEFQFGRWAALRDYWISFTDSPWWGPGIGQNLYSLRYDPHNLLAEPLLAGGVIYFLFLLPMIAICMHSWHVMRSSDFGEERIAAISTVVLSVAGLTTGSVFLSPWFWVALVFSALYCGRHSRTRVNT